jgi:hypothetical protein
MPMSILIETDDGISEFRLTPVERKGRSVRQIHVDSQGHECKPVLMTHDGHVLSVGSTALLHEDCDGNTAERGEIVETDEYGNPLRMLPSTIGRPQRLSEPVSADDLLEHVARKTYLLTPLGMTRDLREMLAVGCIYRIPFRPRASASDHPAFVFSNENGLFLLQCRQCMPEFLSLDQAGIDEYADDGGGDDYDPWEDGEWESVTSGGDKW